MKYNYPDYVKSYYGGYEVENPEGYFDMDEPFEGFLYIEKSDETWLDIMYDCTNVNESEMLDANMIINMYTSFDLSDDDTASRKEYPYIVPFVLLGTDKEDAVCYAVLKEFWEYVLQKFSGDWCSNACCEHCG